MGFGKKAAFTVDPAIIRHLIEAQAGSLEKAILETVMNALDAHATQVAITMTDGRFVTIEDNGRGFKSKREVKTHFGRFGFDHDTTEERKLNRRWGRFGFGRGQIMGFARTRWRSGRVEMRVDIRSDGLFYEVWGVPGPAKKGCRIEAELYEPVTANAEWYREGIEQTLRGYLRYAPARILVNGRQVNEDPDQSRDWTKTTPALYWREKPYSEMGVELYNLGVYVRRFPQMDMGVSGIIVSRRAMALNTARNDVLSGRCEVWKEARTLIQEEARRRRRKGRLNDADKIRLLRALQAGEEEVGKHWTTPLYKMITGATFSAKRLRQHAHGRIAMAPRADYSKGEQLHAKRDAAVFDTDMLDWWRAESFEQIVKKLNQWYPRYTGPWDQTKNTRYKATSFDQLAKAMDERYEEIPRTGWTTRDKAIAKGLKRMAAMIAERMGVSERTIRIGRSQMAKAWTDGASWIAVERETVRKEGESGIAGWTRLHHLLVHELAHDESTGGAHGHSAGFHEAVHDYFLAGGHDGPKIVAKGLRAYLDERKRLGMASTKGAAKAEDELRTSM